MPDEVLKYALCALFVFLIEEQVLLGRRGKKD